MMFITRECDYGIRVIRALADGTKKSSRVIALEEKIPHKFASKVIRKLERADYIQSTRGRNGGYWLCRPLNTITMVDIISAIDATRCLNECLSKDSKCVFKGSPEQPCAVHIELVHAQDMLISMLSKKTMDVVLEPVFNKHNTV